MKRQIYWAVVASALFLLAVAACEQGDAPLPRLSDTVAPVASPSPRVASRASLPAPTPTPAEAGQGLIYAPATVSPSLEEQIFYSNTIVLASLASTHAGTETVPSDPGVAPTYRAVHELRFKIQEYLKGSGPTEILVVVRDEHTYPEESDALSWAQTQLSRRQTDWDDRLGVLFLKTGQPYRPWSGQRYAATRASHFTLSNPYESPWDYTVDTLSRAWLPSRDAGTLGTRSSDAVGRAFITDGSASPPPVVFLAELRTQIAELEATMAAGARIAGFKDCVARRIRRDRIRRAQSYWPPNYREATVASGSASVTEIFRHNFHMMPQYSRFWVTGPGAEQFQTHVDDPDTDPETGYDTIIVTARPLPEGIYTFQHYWQRYNAIPCDALPDFSFGEWTVTVTAPSSTLHEAFFDPVAIGDAVGAAGNNGVLKPAAFRVGGVSMTIQSLKWQNGTVTMKLNPLAPFTGYAIDFIALDGSVSLTLSFDDAGSAKTPTDLTWSVANQPWQAGDLLMLRVRRP